MATSPLQRQRPRRVSAARWLLADARDVTFIGASPGRAAAHVPSIAAGLGRWQRALGRWRAVALARRVLIVGLAAACVLQLGALATGSSGPGLWLLPALAIAAIGLVPGISHRTSSSVAARMLDRDLRLGAGVTTAFELERNRASGGTTGLGGLALADGLDALGQSLGGFRARLRPHRRESLALVLLAAALVALVLVPAVGGGTGAGNATAVARSGVATHHRATTDANDPTRQKAGPDLRGFAQHESAGPSLTGLQAGSTRKAGVASKSNPYGGGTGTANHGPAGSVQPASRTVGNAGYLQNTHTSSSANPNASSEGKAGNGKASLTTHEAPAAGKLSSAGPVSAAPIPSTQQAKGADSSGGIPGHASSHAGSTRGGNGGSSAASAQSGNGSPKGVPGGGTAGGTRGSTSSARGVVPQLGGSKALPIQPGYEAVKGSKGGKGEGASSTANGAGGASHAGKAATGTASAGAAGVAYVPPGGSSVAPVDRRLLIGYFGSFARVSAAGW